MVTGLIIIAIIILAVLAMAMARPAEFSVVRSADFAASPEEVFNNLNDFKNWKAWSPWEAMDANMQRNYSGTPAGKGAKYAWVGNKKVGEGNMEITRSNPFTSIELNLNFLKPFKANNVTEFTLVPKGEVTKLIWEMRGASPFMMKVMGIFMDFDKIVGKDFEQGLANLKSIVEK